jgi:hypothetical protein
LEIPLAVPGADGELAAFGYRAAPPRDLLRWLIDHPGQLAAPDVQPATVEADRLRRMLLDDDPPGTQARAQERARELADTTSPLTAAWWRLEGTTDLDLVLLTDRLALTVLASPEATASFYPPRTEIVRYLEAARQLADDRRYATLVLSDAPRPDAAPEAVRASLADAAPHLDQAGLAQLADAYLGNLTWAQAAAAVDPPGAGN